jgi:serine/threonine-protein kinase Nek2
MASGDVKEYEVLGPVGKGTFGSVERIRRLADGRELVWKRMDYGKMSDKEKQQLVQEVNILQKLRHPNIVRYYDRIIDRPNAMLYIVMEHCTGGDLARLIRRCRRERTFVEEEVVWKVMMQLALALADCHKRQDGGTILHRDIKPGNVFLDEGNDVKLGDFGLSRVLGENSLFAHTYVGTPFYMSPEQVTGSAYNEKCDIWSLGCLIYELASLYPPFEATNQFDLGKKIKAGRFARIPAHYSDDLQRAVSSMLHVSRTKRADIDGVLQLPQVALRVRERRINQHFAALKKKEDDLRVKEEELASWQAQLEQREAALQGQGQGQGQAEQESQLLLHDARRGSSSSDVAMPAEFVPKVLFDEQENSSAAADPEFVSRQFRGMGIADAENAGGGAAAPSGFPEQKQFAAAYAPHSQQMQQQMQQQPPAAAALGFRGAPHQPLYNRYQ